MKKIIFFVMLVFCCSLGCLALDEWLRLEGAELAALESEILALERECDDMALDIASATSPRSLAQQAEELGMVLADEGDRAWLVGEEAEENVPLAEESEGDLFDVVGDLLRRGI